ncbi:unnamed protein product [Diamesa serratosioi]
MSSIDQLITNLDDKNSKILYKQLYKIRVEYIKSDDSIESMRKVNGITRLVQLLTTPKQNEKVLEVILSILGNCTYNKQSCSLEAYKENIIDSLIRIINESDNKNIQSRGCRLLGNLAQFEVIAISLQKSGVALCLANCLVEDVNEPTLIMCLRAIRLMWSSKKFRYEILSFGAIYKIMIILGQYLKNKDQIEAPPECEESSSNVVILKRLNVPDRTISKEKLSNIIGKMEQEDVAINYERVYKTEISSPEFIMPQKKDPVFELVSSILKCLLPITATILPQVARSIFSESRGLLFFIFLADETSPFRSMALKILSNLSSNQYAQEFLSNNELVPMVANLIINNSIMVPHLDSNEERCCLTILCLSSENACNRGKLRRSGVFKNMLLKAKTTKAPRELGLLLYTFYQFRFDQLGIDTLLEFGLIDVLIGILNNIIEKKDVDHIKFDDPSLDDLEDSKGKGKQQKKRSRDDSNSYTQYQKYMRYDPGSPGSSSGYGSNQYQYSPSRSSQYSSNNSPSRSYDNANDSDSDNYSPVCSDNEDNVRKEPKEFDILNFLYTTDSIGKPEEEVEMNEDGNELVELDDETSCLNLHDDEDDEMDTSIEKSQKIVAKEAEDSLTDPVKQFENDPLQFILLLLWKVSINNNSALEFVRPSNLTTLLSICKVVPKPNGRIFQILENIVTHISNFVKILKQNFIFQLHDLSLPIYDHENCYSCSKMKSVSRDLMHLFGNVAQSGYGRGEIAHFLLTGEEEMKKKVAIRLTYIISDPDILNDLLFKYNGLDIAMNIILNESCEVMAAEACSGITVMSVNLNIQLPNEEDVLQRIIPDNYVKCEEKGENLIKFIVKDGVSYFDKEILKRSSDVLCSMLSSDFRESNMNEVHLQDCTVEGIEYFFNLIRLDDAKRLKIIAPKVDNMDVILQAFDLAIRFIITNIQKPLLNVIKIVINERNALNVFEWSLRNVNQDLLITSICYYLNGQISGSKKRQLFKEANQSQFSIQWKQLIIDTILMKCQQ